MQDFIIMIIAHNDAEHVKLSVQSIRMFADVDNLSVIVVDRNSTDGLQEWASEQDDITYVYFDDEYLPFGQMLNMLIQELSLHGDLLIMCSYLLTPFCLSEMRKTLYDGSCAGAVGPLSNNLPFYQKTTEIPDYQSAIDRAQSGISLPSQRVMGLSPAAVLFRADVLESLGAFDETLLTLAYVIRDYCFRMIQNNYSLHICKTALFWDSHTSAYQSYQNLQDAHTLETKWGMHYFNSIYNENLLCLINHNPSSEIAVLEVGCDCGATLLELCNRYPNAQVYGCELNVKAAQVAAHFANVTVNNIEAQDLPYPSDMFDYIIFGDVLEHLKDPLETVRYCKSLLKPNGCIIASIPNLMHISVIDDLLRGNFTYTETGLLDKTHIHFFTCNEIVRLFESANYEIDEIFSTFQPLSDNQQQLIGKLTDLHSTPRFMFESYQYVVRARSK